MYKFILAFTLFCSSATACELPFGTALNAIITNYSNIAFHYRDDEATVIARHHFNAPIDVDDMVGFNSDPSLPLLVIFSSAGCVVSRAVIPPEAVEVIRKTVQEYQEYKRQMQWKENT